MGIRWSTQVEEADWVIERLHPFGQDVGSVIPEGFDAYARVFHPVERWVDGTRTTVRWHEIAHENGRVVHPQMQFHTIVTPIGHPIPRTPGNLPEQPWGTAG